MNNVKIARSLIFVISFICGVVIIYSIFSEIRSRCNDLRSDVLKNKNVLSLKKEIKIKDFKEVYELDVEMLDHTVIRFHWVEYDYWGNLNFSCIEGMDNYRFFFFEYNKGKEIIDCVNKSYLYEKSISKYLDSHDLNYVLDNYKSIRDACCSLPEVTLSDCSLIVELYEHGTIACDWIDTVDKKYLFEAKDSISGCFKYYY